MAEEKIWLENQQSAAALRDDDVIDIFWFSHHSWNLKKKQKKKLFKCSHSHRMCSSFLKIICQIDELVVLV